MPDDEGLTCLTHWACFRMTVQLRHPYSSFEHHFLFSKVLSQTINSRCFKGDVYFAGHLRIALVLGASLEEMDW